MAKKILFLDGEMVPCEEKFEMLSEDMQAIWKDWVERKMKLEEDPAKVFEEKGGLYPEFGKIICLSVGWINSNGSYGSKSFFGDDEKKLLEEFFAFVTGFFNDESSFYSGHNIVKYDVPFICRRAIVHGLKLPFRFSPLFKKPWELANLDTMELWRMGNYKDFISLKALCAILGVPTPKDDISGADVRDVYYIEKDLPRIVTYCEKDTFASAQLYYRLIGEEVPFGK